MHILGGRVGAYGGSRYLRIIENETLEIYQDGRMEHLEGLSRHINRRLPPVYWFSSGARVHSNIEVV